MLYTLDSEGYVINEARREKIAGEYTLLVDEIINEFCRKFGEKMHSAYVRGSVSVGRAQPNISDLDMVVIFRKSATDDELWWCSKLAKRLEIKYTFVTMVDITCTTFDNLLQTLEYRRLRVYLATQSVCLYGDNILDVLGKIKPGRELSIEMYQGLDQELKLLTEYFSDPLARRSYLVEERPPQFWCVWTMRTLLRSGLGLVMFYRPVYSQDLQTCYTEFTKEFPEYVNEMKQALAWAHQPIADKKEIAKYMTDFIPKYLTSCRRVGLLL